MWPTCINGERLGICRIAQKATYSVLFVKSHKLDYVCRTYQASTTKSLGLVVIYVDAVKIGAPCLKASAGVGSVEVGS